MTGLLLIGLGIAWLMVAGAVSAWWTTRLTGQAVRFFCAVLLFALLIPLPVIDEIVGKYQFRALCRENSEPQYDETELRGKTVYMRRVPHPSVPGVQTVPSRLIEAWIPIRETTVDWLDEETRRVVLSYKEYEANGGWLIRALKISETDAPLTFEPRSCLFNAGSLFRQHGITFR